MPTFIEGDNPFPPVAAPFRWLSATTYAIMNGQIERKPAYTDRCDEVTQK